MSVTSKTFRIDFTSEDKGFGVACEYQLVPAGDQSRFVGREAMTPCVNLKDYTVKAVYDWVEIEVHLDKVTQFQHIQRELEPRHGKRLRVERPVGDNAAGQIFRVRFQDPDRDLVEDSIQDIDHRWGIAGPVTIAAIEVSIDFYPLSNFDDDRWRMVGLLQRHFLPLREMQQVDDECRRESKLNDRDKVLLDHINLRVSKKRTQVLRPLGPGRLLLDATTYFRPREASPSWRVMDKITNQRKGAKAEVLKQDERRSRIEVTFDRSALEKIGLTTMADLIEFKPEQLAAGYFTFWFSTIKHIEGAGAVTTAATSKRHKDLVNDFARMGVMATLLDDFQSISVTRALKRHTGKAPIRLGPSGRLLSWTPLNNVVRLALKRLRF